MFLCGNMTVGHGYRQVSTHLQPCHRVNLSLSLSPPLHSPSSYGIQSSLADRSTPLSLFSLSLFMSVLRDKAQLHASLIGLVPQSTKNTCFIGNFDLSKTSPTWARPAKYGANPYPHNPYTNQLQMNSDPSFLCRPSWRVASAAVGGSQR